MPSPEERLPLTPLRFLTSILPAYVCQYVMATLAITPGTRHYRIALLPVALYAAFKAATTCDHSHGDAAQAFQNFGQCVSHLRVILSCAYADLFHSSWEC